MAIQTPTANKIFKEFRSIEFGITKQNDNAVAAFPSNVLTCAMCSSNVWSAHKRFSNHIYTHFHSLRNLKVLSSQWTRLYRLLNILLYEHANLATLITIPPIHTLQTNQYILLNQSIHINKTNLHILFNLKYGLNLYHKFTLSMGLLNLENL